MQKTSNRSGLWLAFLCLAASAATLSWAWKRVEPGVRYRRVLSAFRHSRESGGASGSSTHGDQFWSNLNWCSEQSPDGFLDRIFQSLASTDGDEREDAAILAANLDSWEESRNMNDPSVPLFPPSAEETSNGIPFQIHGALKEHVDVIRRLAVDERRLVRLCFLEMIWGNRERFYREVAAIALSDPDLDMRLKAIPRLMRGVMCPDHETLQQLSKDINPRVRLRATCLLGMEGRSLDALQECVLLLTDPDLSLPEEERSSAIGSLPDMHPALAARCEETRRAINAAPEALRAEREKWKAWFQTKEFEEFAAEISMRR